MGYRSALSYFKSAHSRAPRSLQAHHCSITGVMTSRQSIARLESLGAFVNLPFRPRLEAQSFAALLTVLSACAAHDWQSLFNGKDLAGWRANVMPESFSVVDGAIRANATRESAHLFCAGDTQRYFTHGALRPQRHYRFWTHSSVWTVVLFKLMARRRAMRTARIGSD